MTLRSECVNPQRRGWPGAISECFEIPGDEQQSTSQYMQDRLAGDGREGMRTAARKARASSLAGNINGPRNSR